MKSVKELRNLVFSRMLYCVGELATVFFLSVGGLSVFVLSCMIAGEYFLRRGEYEHSRLIVAAVCTAVFIIIAVAAAPFSYGVSWYRIQQVRGISVHARSMFSCYASIGKMWQVLRLNSILIIKKLCRIIPFAAVSALAFYAAGYAGTLTGNGKVYNIAFTLAVIITIVMIYPAIRANEVYAAVPFLYALDPTGSPAEMIAESKRLMKRNSDYIGEVMLSLLPWLVPCLIIFPMIFVVPYMQMVYAAAVNEIINSDGSVEQDGETLEEISPVTV